MKRSFDLSQGVPGANDRKSPFRESSGIAVLASFNLYFPFHLLLLDPCIFHDAVCRAFGYLLASMVRENDPLSTLLIVPDPMGTFALLFKPETSLLQLLLQLTEFHAYSSRQLT
ncbi:MAG TPA: hypothetical protein PLV70_13565 [Flavobacteriales bacterium]|nr:hypothetical protein [Flavobacteriales bacterium]